MEEPQMHIRKWKKPIWNGYEIYDAHCLIFWKRQNRRDNKKISGCQGLMERDGWIHRAQRTFKAMKLSCGILWWWIHVIIHLSKPTESKTGRVNLNVNYELWVTMCQCRFIDHNKWIALVPDVGSWGGCMGVETGIYENFVL